MTYLRERLLKLWKSRKTPELQHLGLGFYAIHNLCGEDKLKIMASHWRLGTNPMLVRTWTTNFKPANASHDLTTTIWIKLPLLPIEYHSPQTLISIGNLIGKTTALDASRINSLQGIEIDIKSKLPQEICLNGPPLRGTVWESTLLYICFPAYSLSPSSFCPLFCWVWILWFCIFT